MCRKGDLYSSSSSGNEPHTVGVHNDMMHRLYQSTPERLSTTSKHLSHCVTQVICQTKAQQLVKAFPKPSILHLESLLLLQQPPLRPPLFSPSALLLLLLLLSLITLSLFSSGHPFSAGDTWVPPGGRCGDATGDWLVNYKCADGNACYRTSCAS